MLNYFFDKLRKLTLLFSNTIYIIMLGTTSEQFVCTIIK